MYLMEVILIIRTCPECEYKQINLPFDVIILPHNDFFSLAVNSPNDNYSLIYYNNQLPVSQILLLHKTWGNYNKFDSTKSF